MTVRLFLLAATSVFYASAAFAAPVTIDVRGPDGKPIAGAVVAVEAPGVATPPPRGAYSVEQRNIQFQPHVLIVPVGASVAFPNRDKVRHHVYSFSKPKKFDLKLYGREEARTVTFDKPGVVALGCNIHDSMSGFVFVVSTPFAAQTNTTGRVALQGVPAGAVTVRVWHPSIRAPGNTLVQALRVAPNGLSTTVNAR
ncbi:methylamine utilization protein [Sphingomonas sp. SUN019]|uniref:methylamine utilization protein n=1 Tax=Sphingomonas sp. SUN019 TaxID=2937788 RepID=UPI0021641AB0|nr:methylamine utilization protein [Sphingomonas sp. SUN019]UVO49353.1 methylamine utilization protein [Sphingomonas sp. SUN019]